MSVSREGSTPGDEFASGAEDGRIGGTDVDVQSDTADSQMGHQPQTIESPRVPVYSLCEPSSVEFKVQVYRKMGRTGAGTWNPKELDKVSVFVDDKPFDTRVSQTLDNTKVNAYGSKPDTSKSHITTTAFEVVTDVLTYGVSDYSARSLFYQEQDMFPPSGDHRQIVPDFSSLQIKKVSRTHLVITSSTLRQALYLVIGYYTGFTAPLSARPRNLVIYEPYAALMHNYEAITNYADTGMQDSSEDRMTDFDASVAQQDMALLRDFLKPLYERLVIPAKTLLVQPVPQITFEMLWYIFAPGTYVYVQSSEEIYGAVVSGKANLQDVWDSDSVQDITLELWCLDTDGSRIARITDKQDITSFTGVKDVTSLPVCPVSYWDSFDRGCRRQKILGRSRMHVTALRKSHLHIRYEGPDLISGTPVKGKMVLDYKRFRPSEHEEVGYEIPIFDDINHGIPKFMGYDYIFVDEAGYLGSNGERVPKSSKARIPANARRPRDSALRRTDEEPQDLRLGRAEASRPAMDIQLKKIYETSVISEEQLLLLSPRAPAFDLTTKKWHIISMDLIHTIEASDESISNLVMPNNAFQTIRALSSRQQRIAKGWSADFIEGKGSGQIILLHGPPGVGKTYTVESIAEWLERPLLALTVADIGTTETTVEQELLKWFDLAEAWDAVLLVDEADIFLEQRRTRDLARNSLVTAFLRRMEYFKGLLFLTTNRVGQIDDAFISRVHVTIEYEALSQETRARIWNGFFAKLQRERKGKITVAKRAKEYVLSRETSLNGREIRNALQTAIALASYQADEDKDGSDDEPVIVEEGHFKDVLDMSEKFHNYVASIRREDEAKRANVRGDRNDYGNP